VPVSRDDSATGVTAPLPSNQLTRLSTTNCPIAARVSTEAEPMCGSSTVLSSAISASGTSGSSSCTSSPAAWIMPSRSASISAA
jgi:hypothetical protein